MTNEQAIKVIKIKSAMGERAEKLAALYAMDDIVHEDIDTWINTNVSNYLMQFPEIARDLSNDLIKEGVTKEELAKGLCDVSESVFHYVKLHELLNSYSVKLSER